MKKPKLSTEKVKLILAGKYKKPNKKAFLIALTTAIAACQVAMINARPCFDEFSKSARSLQIADCVINAAESINKISKLK